MDITGDDPISRLTVVVRGTNNGATPTAHPAKLLSKIELLDGSRVIRSLSGIQAQAMDYYTRWRPPQNVLDYRNDVQSIACFHLNFGRFLYDPELAFVPSRFKNPQLRLTLDLNGGGSAPDAGSVKVTADMFDERKINPVGLFVEKQHYVYTLVASAYETIKLPVDQILRQIVVQSLTVDLQPWEQYNEIRLSEDNQKRIIVDDLVSNYLKDLVAEWPQYIESLVGATTTGVVDHFITPTYDVNAVLGGITDIMEEVTTSGEYGGALGIDGDTGGGYFQGLVRGHCPHGATLIEMGNRDDIADWYNPQNRRDLELRIKAGSSASGTVEILTQQVEKY
jgi:hypothetical protein